MAENLIYLGYTKGAFIYYGGYDYDSSGAIASYYADLQPNTTYTIKNWDGSSRWRLGLFTDDIVNLVPGTTSSSITNFWDGDNPLTFTTGANNTHMVIYYTNSGEYSTRVMLNEGSTAENYTAPTRNLPHAGIWYLTNNNTKLTQTNLPDVLPMGAFQGCTNLTTATIPRSVTSIGEQSFMGTSLSTVQISLNCTFYPTSFPIDCHVTFYST